MTNRSLFSLAYMMSILPQAFTAERGWDWWLFKIGFLGAIHVVWWAALRIKRNFKKQHSGH